VVSFFWQHKSLVTAGHYATNSVRLQAALPGASVDEHLTAVEAG
jgi:hypothetical protein